MPGLLSANLREHWHRYTATAVAIMLATGFMLTCLAVSGGFYKSMERSFAGGTLGADLILEYDSGSEAGQSSTDTERLSAAAALNTIASAVAESANIQAQNPLYDIYVGIDAAGGKSTYSELRAVPPEQMGRLPLAEGNYPTGSSQVVMDINSAKTLNVQVGQTVTLRRQPYYQVDSKTGGTTEIPGTGKEVKMQVTGLFAGSVTLFSQAMVTPNFYADFNGIPALSSSDAVSGNEDMAVADSVAAQGDALERNLLSAVAYLAAGSTEELRAEIQMVANKYQVPVKLRTQAEYVSERMDSMADGQGVMTAILLIFPVISTVTAVIVVSVTFQVLLAQRKRELALLRAIGATRFQIRSLVTREALLVGALSSALGLVLGMLAGTVANQLAGLTITIPEALSAISPWALLASFLVGVFTTWLGSVTPARRIAQVSPMEALHPEDSVYVKRRRTVLKAVFASLLVVGGSSLVVGSYLLYKDGGDFDIDLLLRFAGMFFGAVISFVGVLLVAQLLTPRLTLALGKVFGCRSVIADIAAENTMRNPGRTGATVTALTLGLTLVSTMLVGSASLSATVNNELERQIPVDFIVESPLTITPGQLEKLRGSSGVAQVTLGDTISAQFGGPNTEERTTQVVRSVEFSSENNRANLTNPGDEEVWINGWMWNQDWGQDTRISLTVGEVTLSLKPVLSQLDGIYVSRTNFEKMVETDNVASPGSLHAGNPIARNSEGTGKDVAETAPVSGRVVRDGVAHILLADDAVSTDVSTLGSAVTAAFPEAGSISGEGDTRVMANQILAALTWGIVAMLAVSVLVALVGVANTLALSVVERRRENAVLRAVGMTRRGMKTMMTTEAALIGTVGTILGVSLGVLYGWIGLMSLPLNSMVGGQDPNQSLQVLFVVPWLQLGVTVVFALAAALTASWLPGRSVAKAAPVAALAEAV